MTNIIADTDPDAPNTLDNVYLFLCVLLGVCIGFEFA